MIVTVAHRKGGVGKTTTAVFVAHALTRATSRPCVVIDADPQGSATEWADRAAADGHPLAVPVLARPTVRLGDDLPEVPHLVIDTPPADADIVAAAVELADLVLVPTTSSSLDLSRVQLAIDAARAARTPSAVLLTRTRRTRSVAAAETELREAGIHVLRTRIALREALAMAFGRPVAQLHGDDLAVAEVLGDLPEQPFSVDAVRSRAAARPVPVSAATPRPAAAVDPIGLGDEEIIRRLRSSMARLTTPR